VFITHSTDVVAPALTKSRFHASVMNSENNALLVVELKLYHLDQPRLEAPCWHALSGFSLPIDWARQEVSRRISGHYRVIPDTRRPILERPTNNGTSGALPMASKGLVASRSSSKCKH